MEARQVFFDRVLKYLIFGNVRRGHLYPLCVGAERGIQATLLAELAKQRGSTTVAHGCTAAGNDQVRFEVALRTISPGLEVLAPVRDQAFIRTEQQKYLEERGFPVPLRGLVLLHQPRPVGRDHRRPGDARLQGVDPGERLGAVRQCVREEPAGRAPYGRLHAGRTDRARRRADGPGQAHRDAGDAGRALRHRPRHPRGRHGARHQGPGGLRGAGRRGAAGRAPRAREARAVRAAAAREGPGGHAVRRLRARGQAARPGVPRHRGAAHLVPAAGHRRGAAHVPARQPVRRGRRLAALADGCHQGRLRREGRRMDAGRRARLLAHPLPARHPADARRGARQAGQGK